VSSTGLPARRFVSLPVATIVAATIAIAASLLGAGWLHCFFKPLTTILVLARAARRGQDEPLARRWVLAGLGWSLIGDVALMWPQRWFLGGLVAFLFAHVAYLVAFTRGVRFASWWPPFGFYALTAGLVVSRLWPGLAEGLRAPVLVYVTALSAMAAQAAVVARRARSGPHARRGVVLALGGALFVVSDSLLAINRFLTPLPLERLWVLVTYWLAQWAIASWLAPRGSAGEPPKHPT